MSKWGRLGILMCLILSTQLWASIGKVSLLKGEASASRNNQTITLANGAALEEHDLISTRANSQIQLTFEDKTVITLGSESILDINQYLNDAQAPKAKFKFNQGTFKSITGNIGKQAPENFNLETKTATIGIRGTTVIGQTSMPQQNGREQPDIIGCSSGKIIVVTPMGSVEIGAGFATTVTPNQAPTPPVPLSTTPLNASSSQPTQSGNVILGSSSTTSTSNQVNDIANNTLQQSTQNNVDNAANNQSHFTPSVGLTGGTLDYNPFESSIDYYAKGIDSTLTLVLGYHPSEYTHLHSYTTLILRDIPLIGINGWADLNNLNPAITGFSYLTKPLNTSNTPVTLSRNNNDMTLSHYALIQDTNQELFIASLKNDDIFYTQKFIIGQQSSTLPTSTILYYADPFDSIAALNYPELTGSLNALAINTANRNALGFSLDGSDNSLIITIGTLDSHNSLSVKDYTLVNSPNSNYINHWAYASLSGAIYGSTNQAIGVSGLEATYNFDGGYIPSYSTTTGIAVKTTTSTPIAAQRYNTVQTLEGLITNSSGNSDLTIQINKNTGAISVASSLLSIDATGSSSKSAYIHDDYFAAITIDTYNNATPLLQNYLIAIPLTTQDDYVSWGYWGNNQLNNVNRIVRQTSPFSTWVAGTKTEPNVIQNLVTNTASYSYTGTVIGAAKEGGLWGYILNDASNSVNLAINFANANPVSGTIAFNTSNSGSWNSTVTTSALTASTSSFTANLASANSNGSLKGNFYGPVANAIAGSFNLSKISDDIASGSFKAIK